MMKAALNNYQARMKRVIDFIERNPEADLSLDVLSGVAAFSKHHFHRQFSAMFGISVYRYVQLSRMKRASYRLAFRDDSSVTDIAFDSGYEAPDAFARAFRQQFGQSPSSFRVSPQWDPWLSAFEPFETTRRLYMNQQHLNEDVNVIETADIPVVSMEHRGSPRNIRSTIERFIDWRKANGLSPASHATYNIFHNDPRTTAEEDYRLDLCVATDKSLDNETAGIISGLIPGGRCARLRVTGNPDNLEPAALFLYREWLPDSGEELRDFPLYCQRVSFFPDVAEQEAITDVFLPLK
ncbi:AraC family transcriptional regulator [Sphingorhabdus sp.]|jgi:AraC family transcriptional regulator|uniref:AraC family transcriptional regulator n=1 Tax=Sphingorhabdus sp. TaxID=1902408 RepID=UPI003BB1F715